MPVTYTPAPEAAKIGRQLIATHHQDLDSERIEYIFRSEAAITAGRAIWGKARKISGLNAYLATVPDGEDPPEDGVDPFFVIELAADIWETLSGKERIALVDHELSHCQIRLNASGTPTPTIVPHDVEEFEGVIRRHGLWNTGVRHFAKVAYDAVGGDQMSLLGDDDQPAA